MSSFDLRGLHFVLTSTVGGSSSPSEIMITSCGVTVDLLLSAGIAGFDGKVG